MALNRTETACWGVTPNFANSSYVWFWSSSSNASNSLSSNFFWLSRARLVFNAEISMLETSKPFPTWFISWSSVIINFDKHSMGFSRTFLPIKAENLPQMLLVNTKFDISNTVKIKVFETQSDINWILLMFNLSETAKINCHLWTIHNSWAIFRETDRTNLYSQYVTLYFMNIHSIRLIVYKKIEMTIMYHETDISVWFIHSEHNRELTYSYTQEREKFYVKQK